MSVDTLPAGPSTAERRQRIVEAALQLFSGTDYGAVQMDDVARTAVVAKPTLYRYFPTKEALFLEVIERLLCELQADVETVADGDRPATEALRGAVRHVFLALSRCTAVIHAFDGADGQLGEKGRTAVRTRVRSIRTVVERILARGVGSGEFRPMEVDLTATAILGACRMSAALAPARRRSAALETLLDFMALGVLTSASAADRAPFPEDLTEDCNR
ncbi:MAG: TetR/AcrR family transcriptional regulator [Alsobacter sp.]